MGRGPVARAVVVLAVLVFVGVVVKLVMMVLGAVLPRWLMDFLGAGFRMLYEMVSPALPAIAALVIVAAIAWTAVAWWRR